MSADAERRRKQLRETMLACGIDERDLLGLLANLVRCVTPHVSAGTGAEFQDVSEKLEQLHLVLEAADALLEGREPCPVRLVPLDSWNA
jgi:hypothetical protein